MAYAIDPPPLPAVPVAGTDTLFPVRRIWCVGRNYAEHAREMGHDPNREPPFFFTKPADAVCDAGGTLPYPPLTADLHHEVELVVAIGRERVGLRRGGRRSAERVVVERDGGGGSRIGAGAVAVAVRRLAGSDGEGVEKVVPRAPAAGCGWTLLRRGVPFGRS